MAPNRYYTSDAAPTTLTASLSAVTSGTTGSVQVASITGYPTSYPFTLLIDWGTASQEVATATQAATGSGPWTYANCVRGDDGSAAGVHALGAEVVHGVSARDFAEPQTHLGSASSVHGVSGALAPLNNPAFTGGRPWYDVIAFGADPTGVADSTAAIQAAINAATGAASPQTASRTPTGPVYIPAGSYLITSDISILSVDGFHLLGAGADMVMLLAKGAAWTAAVININGAANCTFEGFSIQSTGAAPANQFPVGVNVTWTGPYNATTNPAGVARSTTGTTLRNMRVRGNFVTGVSLAGVGTYQLDGEVLEDVIVSGGQSGVNGGGWSNTGLWQNGFIFGNDGWGNIYDQVLRNCGAVSCYYGYYCNASGFALYGAQPGNNGIDFYIYPGAQCTISNVQSQNSGQFISAPAGFSPKPVGVSDCQVVSLAVTTPDVISIPGGQWDIRNFSAIAYSSSGSNVAPVINITGGGVSRQATVTLTNVIMSSTFPAAVSASNAYVTVNNYAYFNPVANTVTGYPPMFYPNSSWQTMLAGFSATAALAFTSPIASGATASLTMTVTGATAGQAVSLGVPATFPAGCVAQGFVSAANTVTVVIANLSGAAVTPGTITVTAEVH